MKWAEVIAKKVNIRLPDLGLTMVKGEQYHIPEQDFQRSEYLRWAVQQGQVEFRWVSDMSSAPPNYKNLNAPIRTPSQAAKSTSGDIGGLLAELVVKTDAARKEQKELFTALLARQEKMTGEVLKLSENLNRLAEALVLHAENRTSYDPVSDQVKENGDMLRSLIQEIGKVRTVSVPVSTTRTVSSTDEDEIRFIPKADPSRIGEVNLEIEEQESEASVEDAMAALRKHRKK